MNKKIIAIIPARGGSKGVPKKNIKSFLGSPLILHSINYAKSSKLINEIYVTTDDKRIKEISLQAGVKVIDRPKKLSSDHATTESAIEHALTKIKNKPDYIVLLQPTSPNRPENSLNESLKKFHKKKYDSMLSISPTHNFFWNIEGDYVRSDYDYKKRPRRQDMKGKEIKYIENGSLYIFTYEHFSTNKNRLGGNIGYIIFPEEYSHEIDTTLDFIIMEEYAKL